MNFAEYKEVILAWTAKSQKVGITFSNGKPIHTSIWKDFIGISRSTHTEIMNGTYGQKYKPKTASGTKRRAHMGMVAKTIEQNIKFANALPEEDFFHFVKEAIERYEENPYK
tara:strand:+ start:1504 stop:1839 length:336 start_codon:yes stop_codon:yes gene_type:complete